MNSLSNAALSASLNHQQHFRVGYELQANASLFLAGLPSQSRRGVEVSRIKVVVFQAGHPEGFKDVAQQQHISLEIEIVMVSQTACRMLSKTSEHGRSHTH